MKICSHKSNAHTNKRSTVFKAVYTVHEPPVSTCYSIRVRPKGRLPLPLRHRTPERRHCVVSSFQGVDGSGLRCPVGVARESKSGSELSESKASEEIKTTEEENKKTVQADLTEEKNDLDRDISHGSGSEEDDAELSYVCPPHWVEILKRASHGRRRMLRRYLSELARVNRLEAAMQRLSDEQLAAKTEEFIGRLTQVYADVGSRGGSFQAPFEASTAAEHDAFQRSYHAASASAAEGSVAEVMGRAMKSLRAEAFAVVREASRRVLGMRHFDSQILGGLALSDGCVAEMATGEGKTLVATLPCFLAAVAARAEQRAVRVLQLQQPRSGNVRQAQQRRTSTSQCSVPLAEKPLAPPQPGGGGNRGLGEYDDAAPSGDGETRTAMGDTAMRKGGQEVGASEGDGVYGGEGNDAYGGGGVHVVTVNDYLATRDAEWMGRLFAFLGLRCAAVRADMPPHQQAAAFRADVTYVTGSELCFSFLRDNTARDKRELALPPRLRFVLVDEADSILVDESRNPMIISAQALEELDLDSTELDLDPNKGGSLDLKEGDVRPGAVGGGRSAVVEDGGGDGSTAAGRAGHVGVEKEKEEEEEEKEKEGSGSTTAWAVVTVDKVLRKFWDRQIQPRILAERRRWIQEGMTLERYARERRERESREVELMLSSLISRKTPKQPADSRQPACVGRREESAAGDEIPFGFQDPQRARKNSNNDSFRKERGEETEEMKEERRRGNIGSGSGPGAGGLFAYGSSADDVNNLGGLETVGDNEGHARDRRGTIKFRRSWRADRRRSSLARSLVGWLVG